MKCDVYTSLSVDETDFNPLLRHIHFHRFVQLIKREFVGDKFFDRDVHFTCLTQERHRRRIVVRAVIPRTDKIDFLVDAIDTLSPKLHLIKYCMDSGIPLVSSMGAGAKYDATKVRITDVSKSFNCPLAYIVRKRLRYMGIKKGFKVVFSEELPDKESIVPCEDRNKKSQVGTISYIPAVFGCVCAQAVIQHLMESK